VLLYHRVASLVPDTRGLCVPADEFREHMRELRDSCHPMTLTELVERALAADLPPRAVAVTFDDGYLDNLTAASPILTELGIPATFFVVGGPGHRGGEYFWDTLERIFERDGPLPAFLELADPNGETRHRHPTVTREERAAAHNALGADLYGLPWARREALLASVMAWSAMDLAPRESHRSVTADELRQLAGRPGHSIGAHTVNHLCLPEQDAAAQSAEIVGNKTYLESVLGTSVPVFSYPYGAFNSETVDLVADAGFRMAITVERAPLTSQVTPFTVPRVEIRSAGREAFAQTLDAVFRGVSS